MITNNNNLNISYKNIIKVAYRIVIGLIAQNLMSVIDTAMIGRLNDPVAMGGVAIGVLYYLAVVMLGLGFGTGAQIYIGRRNGEKNYESIGPTFYHCLYFMMSLAVILFLFMTFFSDDFLGYFVADKSIYESSMRFMEYRKYSVFLAFINVTSAAFFVGTIRTKVLSYSTIFNAIVNTVLAYILIFGKFGFPQMDVAGAAIASTVAEAATTAYYIFFFFRNVNPQQYNFNKVAKFRMEKLISILKISFPTMLQNFISFGAWFAFFLMVEKYGQNELAASNIIRSIYLLLMIPIWGLSAATNTLVSNLIGQGRYYKVIPLIKKVAVLSLACTIVLLLICYINPMQIMLVYTSNIKLIEISIPVFYIISIAMIFFSISIVVFNGVTGTGNTLHSLIIEVFAIGTYLLFAYLVVEIFKLSFANIWISEIVYFVVIGTISIFYLKIGKWKTKNI